MTNVLRTLTLAALLGGLALPLAAAPPEDGKKKDDKAAAEPANMYKLPDTVVLTDEQNAKLAEVKKEYVPKFQALSKKGNDVLTKEQRKARREAQAKAKEEGKKGKELQAAVDAAVMLSDEQKKQMDEVKAETADLKAEMEAKVVAFLTPEQKAQVEEAKKKAGKKAKKAAKNS